MSRPRTRAIKTLVCLICGEPLSAQQIYDESSTHGACYRERQREEKAAKAAASDGSPIDRRRVRFRRDEGIPDRPGKPVSSITGWPTAKFAGILSPLAKCPWGRGVCGEVAAARCVSGNCPYPAVSSRDSSGPR